MNKSYTFFNILCLGFLGGFVFATLWFWRGEIRAVFVEDGSDVVPVVSRRDVIEDNQEETNESIEKDETDNTSSTPDNEFEIEEESNASDDSDSNLEEQLPPSINLAVPFTSQAPEKNWDQPWQDACEEAAVLMMDAYYKDYNLSPLFAKDELWKMVKWEEERGWGGSIDINKIQQVVEKFVGGIYTPTIIEDPTVEQIKTYIANGHPVLVVADGKVLPNPHFQNGGPVYHALVIRGYTETEFITNDPGTQHGENFKYTYDDLMNSIRDWNGGDVKSARRVVLVLE